MAATIKIKNSSTAGAAPTSSDLVQGELAVNVTDKRLYTENASGTIVELGTNPSVPVTFPDGSASAPSLTNDGDTNTGIFFPAADTVGITTGGSERARVDSSGNFGVGITSIPNYNSNLRTVSFNNTSGVVHDYCVNGTRTGSFVCQSSGFDLTTQTAIPLIFSTNATERMRLDSSGNLGLGVTPSTFTTGKAIQVASADGGTMLGYSAAFEIGNNWYFNSGYKYGGTGTATRYVMSVGSHQWYYAASGTAGNAITFTQAMTLDASGNLLVGTTTKGAISGYGNNAFTSSVADGGGAGALVAYSTGVDNSNAFLGIKSTSTTSSSQRFIQFYANAGATGMGGIVGNGAGNVQFATLSDAREKTNIQLIAGSLDKIKLLKPSSFDWISDGSHVKAGFIAQEVQQVFPEFVVENVAKEGDEPRLGLTGGMTGGIVAHLVAAIQEQQAIIEQLQADVAALKG